MEEKGLKGGAAAEDGVGGKVGKAVGAGETDEPGGAANGDENDGADDTTLLPPKDGKLLLPPLVDDGNDELPNGDGPEEVVVEGEAPNEKGVVAAVAVDEEEAEKVEPVEVLNGVLPPKLNG